jgi:hypothetical protein
LGVVDEKRQCGGQGGEEGGSLEMGEEGYYADGRREADLEPSPSSLALGRSS